MNFHRGTRPRLFFWHKGDPRFLNKPYLTFITICSRSFAIFTGLNGVNGCNFLNIAQIELNTIPNDSKLDAESKNHNQKSREDDF